MRCVKLQRPWYKACARDIMGAQGAIRMSVRRRRILAIGIDLGRTQRRGIGGKLHLRLLFQPGAIIDAQTQHAEQDRRHNGKDNDDDASRTTREPVSDICNPAQHGVEIYSFRCKTSKNKR